MIIAGLMALNSFIPGNGVDPLETDTTRPGSRAFTYHNYSGGVTLVWLSYPAENEFTGTKSEDKVQP